MALVGASHGSGATIISDGMSTVGRDPRQGPVRKMRGLIAGATTSAESWHQDDPHRREDHRPKRGSAPTGNSLGHRDQPWSCAGAGRPMPFAPVSPTGNDRLLISEQIQGRENNLKNRRDCVRTVTDDDWPIGMLPDGTLNIVSVRGAQQPSAFRSREAARPTDLTDQDLMVLLAEVISELARLQVEAWFEKAQRSV